MDPQHEAVGDERGVAFRAHAQAMRLEVELRAARLANSPEPSASPSILPLAPVSASLVIVISTLPVALGAWAAGAVRKDGSSHVWAQTQITR